MLQELYLVHMCTFWHNYYHYCSYTELIITAARINVLGRRQQHNMNLSSNYIYTQDQSQPQASEDRAVQIIHATGFATLGKE
jgi:hypothetical protein